MDDVYICKVLNGETNAFRFIIKKYKDIGYSLAMSVVKDEFEAQEVLQTSFILAFTKLATFKGKSKFSTWLYRIVINEAFKLIKTQKNEIVTYGMSPDFSTHVADDVTSIIEEDEQRYYINEALKILAPKESLALRLFYLEENSIEEIAEITGWTNSNIKVILHRARINLRQLLKNYFNIDKQLLNQ